MNCEIKAEMLLWLVPCALLAACTARDAGRPAEFACPASEPVRATPPADSALPDPPGEGWYFVNADRSLWASAPGRGGAEPQPWRAGGDGVKVGWFRPEGAVLEIVGERLDAEAPALTSSVPCCYPTRFQASGLTFPTAGCWRITATAADAALSFVVRVEGR